MCEIKILASSTGLVCFDTIVTIDLAFNHVVEFVANHLLAYRRDVIDKHMSLKMVALVLDYAGEISVDVLVVLNPVFIKIMDVNLGVACHILVNAGHTQAPFFASLGGTCLVDGDFRVDKHHAFVLKFRELVA